MSQTHYQYITPDQVAGPFLVDRLTNFDEDDYAYLFAQVAGKDSCIIYNYPPEVGLLLGELEGHLPAWCRFDEDEYLVAWQPEDTGECPE